MAKSKKKSEKSKKRGRGATTVRRSGTGPYCITTTAPKSGEAGKGKAGGLIFQTTCYKKEESMMKALPRRKKEKYSAMIYRRQGQL